MKKLSVLFLTLTALFFSSCAMLVDSDDFDDLLYSFADSGRYSYGNCCIDEDADTLNIDWYYGSVKIVRTYDRYVSFYEESSTEITTERRVRHYFDYKTGSFYVKFCSPTSNKRYLQTRKILTVKIPRYSNITEINVHNKNGDILIELDDECCYQVNTNGCNCCCFIENAWQKGDKYRCGRGDVQINTECDDGSVCLK